jgi:uncharacterized protein YjbI with pentapeptide repeats
VWLQRITVLVDLAVVWFFWAQLRSDDEPIGWAPRKSKMYLGGAGTLCVLIFSIYLASFPGEWMKTHLPQLSSLQAVLFEGDVDPVTGRPLSLFSNRLVLTDQSFVIDPEKLDKIAVSRSFRGRDLRSAVLHLTDLRKADFAGAQLQGASLGLAQLQGALLNLAQLQGASLELAQLQGASLYKAQLQGASLKGAFLQSASLEWAQLQGTSLYQAQASGASFFSAQLQGAWLEYAQLQGASLREAQLQGASLKGALLQGALLHEAQLQGASLREAQLQGTHGSPKNVDLTDLDSIDATTRLSEKELERLADSIPLAMRNVFFWLVRSEEDVLDPNFWDNARSSQLQGEEFRRKRAMFLADLACLGDSAPYVASGLLRNLESSDPEFLDAEGLKLFTDRLLKGKSDPATCPGVRGFTDTDWAGLSKLSPETLMSR